MPYEKDPMVRVFSLWETRKKRDDGTETRFWSGICGGVRYVMFRSKSNHPQAPMFDVYVTPFRKDRAKGAATPKDDKDDFRPAASGDQEQEQPKDVPVAEEGDEKLPF